MLQLSDELPLLLVHVKVDAPVGYHLTRTQKYFALLRLTASERCYYRLSPLSLQCLPAGMCNGRSVGAPHPVCWARPQC